MEYYENVINVPFFKKGTLPWPHNSTDLKWFKSNTVNDIVVMGSTTWEDPGMPRPLPKRTNVIATTRPAEYPGANKYISGDLNKSVVRISDIDYIPEGVDYLGYRWA